MDFGTIAILVILILIGWQGWKFYKSRNPPSNGDNTP